MSFEQQALGGLLSEKGYIRGPFGSALKRQELKNEGIPVYEQQQAIDGHRRFRYFVDKTKHNELKRFTVKENDLILSCSGTVGRVSVIKTGDPIGIISQALLILRPNTERLLPKFLYYFLTSLDGQASLLAASHGAVQQNIAPRSVVEKISIPLPGIVEQLKITALLGALDDRITLLRETNATLEAIAQALFKSWFVDFDPVRAKMEGRAPEGMDEDTARLFPDALEESELGLVPRGWHNVSLREAVSIHDSKRIPLSGQERAKRKGPYPYYGAAALMDAVDDYIFDGVYLLTGEDGSVANANGFPIMQYVWGKFWVNNHAHILQGKDGVSTEHVMLAMQRTNITPYITGAVQAKLSQSNMWRINFLKPPREVAEHFGSLLEPMFDRFRHNSDQAQTLIALRDTLLPRLISGHLRLAEAESQIEAVAA